jgi:hypothetical protein
VQHPKEVVQRTKGLMKWTSHRLKDAPIGIMTMCFLHINLNHKTTLKPSNILYG